MTRARLAELQEAAKMIEVDGVEGYHSCARRFGRDVADALVVAHVRRARGALQSYPPPERVAAGTNRILTTHGLIED